MRAISLSVTTRRRSEIFTDLISPAPIDARAFGPSSPALPPPAEIELPPLPWYPALAGGFGCATCICAIRCRAVSIRVCNRLVVPPKDISADNVQITCRQIRKRVMARKTRARVAGQNPAATFTARAKHFRRGSPRRRDKHLRRGVGPRPIDLASSGTNDKSGSTGEA